MSTMPLISSFGDSHVELESSPIDPSWITEGTPVARSVRFAESPDTRLTTGIWDCTEGKFRWTFFSDEIVHILEGEVFVNDGTRTHHLVAGSIAYFPAGLQADWHVPKYVRKMYIGRATRRSRLRRFTARVERKVAKLAGL